MLVSSKARYRELSKLPLIGRSKRRWNETDAEDIPSPKPEAILKVLNRSGFRVDIAFPIGESLEQRFKEVTDPITGLRACLLFLSWNHENKVWHVVEWKEGPADVAAVYKVEDTPGAPCGSLIVKGVGRLWQPDGRRFSKSEVEWTVADIKDIKDMLPPIQNMIGTLHGPQVIQTETSDTDTDDW